jgi:hypothetical protein
MKIIPLIAFAASGATLLAPAALARDYGIYSGRGYNPAFVWRGEPKFFSAPWAIRKHRLRATFGTAGNPAPICAPALLFEVSNGTPIYNAPGRLLSGTYRVVFP